MYRILDGTCHDMKRKRSFFNTVTTNSISFSSNDYDNITSFLHKLTNDLKNNERQRKHIVNSLKQVLKDAGDVTNFKETSLKAIDHEIKTHNGDFRSPTSKGITEKDVYGIRLPKYLITCENIHEVQMIKKIGHGVSKQTFKAEFQGRHVAVKMVTRHQIEVKSCLEKLNTSDPHFLPQRTKCFVFSSMKLMKEILLLQQLNHPGFVQLIGFCIRSEESDTTDLSERGIVSVFELGNRITVYGLQTLPWQERLHHALTLAEFLHYLEHSPLGSLRVRDFKAEHFLMVDGSLKMIDLDDVDNLEPSCSVYVSIETQMQMARSGKSNGCGFSLPCQKGLCIGFNAKQNMVHMNRLFFKHLLFPVSFPREILNDVGFLLADIDSVKLSASQLIQRLEHILSVSKFIGDLH